MAGHKFLGYAASLWQTWQALFASFIHFYARFFPFKSTHKSTPDSGQTPQQGQEQRQRQQQQQQQQQQRQPEQQQAPHQQQKQQEQSLVPLQKPGLSSHEHSIDFNLSTEQNPDSYLYQPSPPKNSQLNQASSFIDLEQGLDSDFQDASQEDTMAQPKKRGHKRGSKGPGPKNGGTNNPNASNASNASNVLNAPNAPNASNVPNVPTAAQQNDISNKPPGNQTRASSLEPRGTTLVENQGDTKVHSHQPVNHKPAGFKKGNQNRNLPPSGPSLDNRKENGAHRNNPSTIPQAQLPALKPLPTENQAQNQKTGTRSQHVTTAFVPPNNSAMAGNAASKRQAENLAAGANCLTLDDISGNEPSPKPEAKNDSVAGAAKAPAPPITVALPLTDKTSILKPPPPPVHNLPGLIEPQTEEERVEREKHLFFMREALAMGNLALNTNETPVGCVLVHKGKVIAKGMNATNVTRNGTRHAEFMALTALLSREAPRDVNETSTCNCNSPAPDHASCEGAVPTEPYVHPYGQKLHPSPEVHRSIISECILYVTVEPCVMCASLLRQLGIKKVYFGAVNDKFGGTGGVFKIHQNSKPVPKPLDRPYQNGYGPQDASRIYQGKVTPALRGEDDGDGGNIEPGYPVEGGYLRDEAVSLLRRFYVQENGRAPQPRKKEGRAARLFAMENQGKNGSGSELSDGGGPADQEVAADSGEAMEMAGNADGPVGANSTNDASNADHHVNGATNI
ncbi:cytidine deaminase-like protein [Daldinia sp. FL1419]|nr:cytidine deaminase-like protein [Daldinia sp. FL1419]